jgi:hypothetical protein
VRSIIGTSKTPAKILKPELQAALDQVPPRLAQKTVKFSIYRAFALVEMGDRTVGEFLKPHATTRIDVSDPLDQVKVIQPSAVTVPSDLRG